MTPFDHHKQKWVGCRRCGLCTGRSRVCIFRGKVPCDVLVVGEAPGMSEDVLGVPFVGPAGKLQDRIVENAVEEAGLAADSVRVGFSNVVACFPAEAKASGNHAPPPSAIKACAPRLKELIAVCRPRLIVCSGELAKKWIHLSADTAGDLHKFCSITHPAALLRMPLAQRDLAVQRCVVTLKSALEEAFFGDGTAPRDRL